MASNPQHSDLLQPTFRGFIGTTFDALVLFESCLSGNLGHIARRPHDRERAELIRSGNVFIYEEHSSGIKRWTDGVPWSPSRILGNFLIYRELDKPFPQGEKKRALKRPKPEAGVVKTPGSSRSNSIPNQHIPNAVLNAVAAPYDPTTGSAEDIERCLIGSLTDTYDFRKEGLVKKTISVTYRGVQHHLVSYYTVADVMENRLRTPVHDPQFLGVRPRSDLVASGNFRAPVEDIHYAIDPAAQHYLIHPNSNDGYHAFRSNSMPQIPMAAPTWENMQQMTPNSTYNLPQVLQTQLAAPNGAQFSLSPSAAMYSHSANHYGSPVSSSHFNGTALPISSTHHPQARPSFPGYNISAQNGYAGVNSFSPSQMNSFSPLVGGTGIFTHGLPQPSYGNTNGAAESAAGAADQAVLYHNHGYPIKQDAGYGSENDE